MNVSDIVRLNADFGFPRLLIVEIDGEFAACLCEGGGSAGTPQAMLTIVDPEPPTLTGDNIHIG